MGTPILKVENLNKKFGGVIAIQDLSFVVERNEIVGFLGPNGAGKSTMLNMIAGDITPDTGRVIFNDQDITTLPLYKRSRVGITRTYQIPQPFSNLSVHQNVAVAAMYGLKIGKHAAGEKADELLELTGLDKKSNYTACDLEEISLKRLELARSLAADPQLLLIDELAGGLTEKEIPQVVALLKDINAKGVTIVLIEHVMKVMMKTVGRIIVVEEGKMIAGGDPEQIIHDPRVIEAYFG